jgi:hypothetical protein
MSKNEYLDIFGNQKVCFQTIELIYGLNNAKNIEICKSNSMSTSKKTNIRTFLAIKKFVLKRLN